MTNQRIQLTLRGPVPRDGAPSADDLRREYQEQHCVRLPEFLDASLLAWMRQQLAGESLKLKRHADDLASELGPADSKSAGVMTFLVNDPVVLRFVADTTGISRLTRCVGRIYHRIPGTHHDSWHDDILPDRLVGMSVNLNVDKFEGGQFQIRDTATERHLGEIANTGVGDAILFAIGEGLQHRMAPLVGSVPKTAYAGWFGAIVDYNDELRNDPALEKP